MSTRQRRSGWHWLLSLFLLGSVGWATAACNGAESRSQNGAGRGTARAGESLAGTQGDSDTRPGRKSEKNDRLPGSTRSERRVAMGQGSPPPANLKGLSVSVLDIGQGDAILIQMPSGRAVLIDAGPSSGADLLLKQLKLADLSQIDLLVATHPHEDHIGGMTRVLNGWTVKNYTDSGTVHTTATYRNLMEKLKEKNVPARIARRGQKYKLDPEVFLEVLSPREPLFNGTESDLNNNSVVMRLTYGAFSMLFTGDSEEEAEGRLVQDGVLQPISVLKVGHHGSHSSSTADFIDALKPKLAIASLGTGNDYGHPHDKTLKTMASRNIQFLRTDLEGQIRVITDGKQLWVETFHRDVLEAATDGSSLKPSEIQGPMALGSGSVAANAPPPAANPSPRSASADSGDAATAGSADATGAKFVASKKSKMFHDMECGNGQKITEANRVYYKRREDALADGKEPAKDCHP